MTNTDLISSIGLVAISPDIHSPYVTSDLASGGQKADDFQGAIGTADKRQKAPKLFEIKILTTKPYGHKILQSKFAKPAPVKAFRRGGGGGTPQIRRFSQNETEFSPSPSSRIALSFRGISTACRA
jgi:hypothetical protein